MHEKKMTRRVKGETSVTLGKLGYSYLVLLAAVALPSAVPAWSQSQNTPGALQQSTPARVPPNLLNGPGIVRRAPFPHQAPGGSAQAQAAVAIPPFANYSFISINVPNSTYVQPDGVNDAGLVVGSYSDASNNNHGFTWQNGMVQTLDYPGGTATFLTGVNNRGVLIGYYQDTAGNQHVVTYSIASSAWSVLPDIPDYPGIQPGGINDHGEAVGYAYGYFGTLAWVWHPDSQSYSFFTVPGAREGSTYPFGINDANQVVGLFVGWPTDTELGFLRGGCREGEDEDTDRHCYQQINVPGSFAVTSPTGINNHGTIAGWFLDPNFNGYGFVRTSNGAFTAVNAPAGVAGTTQINGINDAGAICGTYYTSSGQVQGFVAYPE